MQGTVEAVGQAKVTERGWGVNLYVKSCTLVRVSTCHPLWCGPSSTRASLNWPELYTGQSVRVPFRRVAKLLDTPEGPQRSFTGRCSRSPRVLGGLRPG